MSLERLKGQISKRGVHTLDDGLIKPEFLDGRKARLGKDQLHDAIHLLEITRDSDVNYFIRPTSLTRGVAQMFPMRALSLALDFISGHALHNFNGNDMRAFDFIMAYHASPQNGHFT